MNKLTREEMIRKIMAAICAVVVLAVTFVAVRYNILDEVKGAATSEDIEKFPESYKAALYKLKEKHPNWTFVADNTGIDWEYAVNLESTNSYCVIPSYFPADLRTTLWSGTWYNCSKKAIEQYMDPRNWLDEDGIFQFLTLEANPATDTMVVVAKALENTFMEGPIPGEASGITYAQAFLFSGLWDQVNVSPVHLASRVRQEQGVGTYNSATGKFENNKGLISGTYPGYEGLYNYYNIGATGTGDTAIRNGLEEARREGWTSRFVAIRDGAKKVANQYIRRGQNTLYLQKFDLVSMKQGTYLRQYMQNICAPTNEGKNTKNAYEKAGAIDAAFIFKIPVYKNMPNEEIKDGETGVTVYDGFDYAAVYNKAYYTEKYPELKELYGDDEYKLLEDFVKNGIPRGRQASENFNVMIYARNYSDLVKEYGGDIEKYYIHYCESGKAAGKKASTLRSSAAAEPLNITTFNGVDYSKVYNTADYLKYNEDLKQKYGNDSFALIRHFALRGMSEARRASQNFDVKYYWSNYIDLRNAFGSNVVKYYQHYMKNGYSESRKTTKLISGQSMIDNNGQLETDINYIIWTDLPVVGKEDEEETEAPTEAPAEPEITIYKGIDYSAVYDREYYIQKYPEIAELYGDDREKILEDFVTNGIIRGRQGSEEFNVIVYAKNYGDLVTKYAEDIEKYYLDYIGDGQLAGRNARLLNAGISSKPLNITTYDGVDYSSVYNTEDYLKYNADLQEKYGENSFALIRHFALRGMNEARRANKDFNVQVYWSNYNDLRNSYGSRIKQYYLHYVNNGYMEKREATKLISDVNIVDNGQKLIDIDFDIYNSPVEEEIPIETPTEPTTPTEEESSEEETTTEEETQGPIIVTVYNGVDYSPVYNMEYYIEKYPEVGVSYGTDSYKILEDFVRNGIPRGRQASEDFNVFIYGKNYSNLIDKYAADIEKYYMDYITEGYLAGRNAKTLISANSTLVNLTVYKGVDYSPVYNVEDYLKYNPDLKEEYGDNYFALIKHFVERGMVEARRAKTKFDVKIYWSNYADLRNAFGTNVVKYYTHYIKNGQYEGRWTEALIAGTSKVENMGQSQIDTTYNIWGELYVPIGQETPTPEETTQPETTTPEETEPEKPSEPVRNPNFSEGPNGYTIYKNVDYSPVYDYNYYAGKYPNIVKDLEYDKEKVFEDFIYNGMKEGRYAKSGFKVDVYKNNYEDLRNAFGDDLTKYYRHYCTNGQYENRKTR